MWKVPSLGRWLMKPTPLLPKPHQEDIPLPHKACSGSKRWSKFEANFLGFGLNLDMFLGRKKIQSSICGYRWILLSHLDHQAVWENTMNLSPWKCRCCFLIFFSNRKSRTYHFSPTSFMIFMDNQWFLGDVWVFIKSSATLLLTRLNQRCYRTPLHLVLSGCTSLQSKWSAWLNRVESSWIQWSLCIEKCYNGKAEINYICSKYSIYRLYHKDQQILPQPAGVACLNLNLTRIDQYYLKKKQDSKFTLDGTT